LAFPTLAGIMTPIVKGRPDGHSLTIRERLLAAGAFVLLSFVYTYPLVTAPGRANRLDSPDAMLNSWIVSWCLYQLPRDPARLFDAGIFFPERGTLAYSENLVTGALLASPVALVSRSPVLLFNVVLLAGFVTTGYATFLLAYDLTRSRLSALLAGVLFTFAPYRFAHLPHLQLELAFGIPLSICFARRILLRGEVGGLGAILGFAAVVPLTFGSSVYYAVYVATILPLVVAFELAVGIPGRRLAAVGRLAAAAALGALATLPLVLPYWEKLREGIHRPLEVASGFSATPIDYVSSFSRLHFFLPKTGEPLFPGFAALVLAGAAIVTSGRARSRVPLLAALGAVGVILSMGPSLGLFSLLYRLIPAYHALRVPSRAGVVYLLAVSLLAAVGLARITRRPVRVALVALALAECFCGPLSLRMEEPPLPPIYRDVSNLRGDGALLELPLPPPERFQDNAVYVYRAILHRRPLVNGYSGFVPASYREAFRRIMENDLSEGLSGLASEGLRYVLAHEGRLGPRILREIDEAEREGRLVELAKRGPDRLFEIRELTRP
jgi:hypothetical protein